MLAGDGRLLEKLRREELVPLGSRIRARMSAVQREITTLDEKLYLEVFGGPAAHPRRARATP